ncbi:MAG: FG-GAP repeat protein, partial [Gemmatimonadetes bacterium]|nr:FG-GAP repeat protein [Gemmatimonadota bacterium]
MRSLRNIFSGPALLLVVAVPCPAQSGSFGNSVVVGPNELIITEPNNTFRPGVVYVYRKSGGSWREVGRLTAPDAERADGFGAAVAATGGTLFVAQRGGRIHVFSKQGGEWRARGTLPAPEVKGLDPGCNQYGYCGTDFGLAMAAAGDWLLVGEPGSPSDSGDRARRLRGGEEEGPAPPGVVHVFHRGDDGAWAPVGRLSPRTGAPGDRFGAAVALGDGIALVGAPGASGGSPTAEPNAAGRRGGQAAETAGAPEVLPGAGGVFEYRLENGTWREVGALPARSERDASFGRSVALDGDVAVVGAPGAADGHGAAFLFRRDPSTGVWAEPVR